jgi:uncharacterized membrane protein HdeD (DUF308 family)
MLTAMQQNWWVLVLRGLLSIVFGILVLVWPGIALESLILLVAAYFLIDGVVEIITFIQRRAVNPQWLWGVLEGVVSVLAGIGAFLFPGITALILLYLIAVYAIMTGVLQLIAAWQLRKEIEGEIWLGLGGLLSVIAGILLILFPGTGALAVLGIIAAYAILFGIILIVLGFRLRNLPTSSSGPMNRAF